MNTLAEGIVVDMTEVATTTIGKFVITRLTKLEVNEINKALVAFKGNKVRTAKALGIGRSTLYRKMKKYNLSITK